MNIPLVSFDLTRTIDGHPRRIFESVRVGDRVSQEIVRCARSLLDDDEQPPIVWSAHPHDGVPNTDTIFPVGQKRGVATV